MFLLITLTAPCRASEDPYLSELIAKAQQRELYRNRNWQILLHYKPSFMGVTSLIDDPGFFLSGNGKHDPEAELVATLKAFFQPGPENDEHPRCRFVARYAWLRQELGIDEARLPALSCNEFQHALDKVQPGSAVLIFPTTHVNSPASMLGHTLISIQGPYKSKLLAYAVNYSAITDETNGLAYAIKGILGVYRGYFSILPYYEKLREYSDLQRRDVWEYDLNLTEEETRRMFLHIWELRDIYSDYFFFDENCSYNLLFLLETARPELDLTGPCRPWVIPIDTVRIIRESGLVKEAFYRPSKATRISHIASQMSDAEQKAAVEVIAGETAPEDLTKKNLTRDGEIRILDLAAETIEFRYFEKELTREEYQRRYLALLNARSRLGQTDAAYTEIPAPFRPDLGHGSNRLSVGAGFYKKEFFQQVSIRPAYHNLLDADQGYLAGSQIDFGNLVLRYYPRAGKSELHALDLINIFSISPRDRFFKPKSWKVDTGFFQTTFSDGSDHLAYRLNSGRGFAYKRMGGLFYSMLEADLLVSGRFRHHYALGLGGSAGWLKNMTESWKVYLRASKFYYELGDDHQNLEGSLGQSFRITADNAITLELSRHKEFGNYYSEAVLNWNYYW
ncbi:MAG: DUF4105 domain-containing protein [bacterium]